MTDIDLLLAAKLYRHLDDHGDANDSHYPIFGLKIYAVDFPLTLLRMEESAGKIWMLTFAFELSRGTNVDMISYPIDLMRREQFRVLRFQGDRDAFDHDMVKARLVV